MEKAEVIEKKFKWNEVRRKYMHFERKNKFYFLPRFVIPLLRAVLK